MKIKRLEDSNYKLIIYNTIQQEMYKTLVIKALKECKGWIIIVYEINNEYFFKNIEKEWIKVINYYINF